jgi:hypothetical protein
MIRTRVRPGMRGVAVIEFTLSLLVMVPLVLGVFVFGFRLIRALQMDQIARDLGHMYVRGVNFRNPGPVQNAQTLASGFNLSSGGTSLVILSQVKIAQQADCDAGNPGPAGRPCPNLNLPVYTEQMTIGNTSAGASAFGTPPVLSDFTVSPSNMANGATSVAVGFANVLVLKPGEIAYVAEMFNQTPELNIPGFSGKPLVYARSIY